jgi:hypothetical protein
MRQPLWSDNRGGGKGLSGVPGVRYKKAAFTTPPVEVSAFPLSQISLFYVLNNLQRQQKTAITTWIYTLDWRLWLCQTKLER